MTLMMLLATLQSVPGYLPAHGGGWWWFPFAFVFWVGCAAAIVYLLTRVTGKGQQLSGAHRARDILAERFARGEISSDEYEERLSHLS